MPVSARCAAEFLRGMIRWQPCGGRKLLLDALYPLDPLGVRQDTSKSSLRPF